VKFDLAHPTQRQVRDGLISGAIAESITIPILLAVLLVHGSEVRWGYILGAFACIVVSVVYMALFVVVTKGRSNVSNLAKAGFVVVCLALAALALMELGSSNRIGTFIPAVLVGVTLISVIGDRRMRVGIDVVAIALVVLVSWIEGFRGSDLVAGAVVYASTIVIITWIIARALGSRTHRTDRTDPRPDVGHVVDGLYETLENIPKGLTDSSTDVIQTIFQRGLPLVAEVMPADQIAVFLHNAKIGHFTALVTWPGVDEDVSDLGLLPQLSEALRVDAVVLDEATCAIPVGYCFDGELVMMVRRSELDRGVDARARDMAEQTAVAFLRMTSRANFVSGLQAESRTDPLTGLANRRCLYERIEIEMAHALRSETPLSVAMIDLDHFKAYNEHYGHVAGDILLRSLAALMVSNIRGQDLVSRYGGEEFCLVMPETDLVGAHHLLDKLRSGGREATTEFGVTLSAGLTSWDGIEDTASFIERADQALYRAKETGRNRVVSIQAFTEF
jgi:diguanylate cyclase (GGDEF)-like protein